MTKEELIKFEGKVTEILPNNMFRIKLNENDFEIIAYLSGKLKQNKIKILAGDKVRLEVSGYDLHRGRIVYRL